MTRFDQIRRQLEAAQQEVFALCKGKRWRMTIPVQDDDSDRTLMASLGDVRDLLAVVEKAVRVRDAFYALPDSADTPLHNAIAEMDVTMQKAGIFPNGGREGGE